MNQDTERIEYLSELSQIMNMEVTPAELIEKHSQIRTILNKSNRKETASAALWDEVVLARKRKRFH